MVLWSAKVPKALRQSGKVLPHKATSHQKNSGTLFCAGNGKKIKVFARSAQNHFILGLVVLIVLFCNCFVDFPALGIDGRPLVKPVRRSKQHSVTPKKCDNTIEYSGQVKVKMTIYQDAIKKSSSFT